MVQTTRQFSYLLLIIQFRGEKLKNVSTIHVKLQTEETVHVIMACKRNVAQLLKDRKLLPHHN